MRLDGNLKSWNDERGFGFIEAAQGGQEIFVHIKAFPPGTGRPSVGQALTFEVELGPNGKKRARSVQYPVRVAASRRPRPESTASWTLPRLLALPIFATIYYFVATHWSVKPWVPLVYAVASLVAFLAYAVDKSAAVQGRWRISEQALHLCALAGGWPGALFAQQLLRHKSSKPSFVAAFWGTVVVNTLAFVAWHSGIEPVVRM
jgi:uncharacterized membrane protein YsdA (DUF1294 family)/cold shock CspA family protein